MQTDIHVLKCAKKSEIIQFLNLQVTPKEEKNLRVDDLYKQLDQLFQENKEKKKEFYETFKIGLSPFFLEQILNCTQTERKRWTQEGKLKVIGYDTWKYGDVPIYDRWQAENLTKEEIEAWRESHKKKVAENRKKATQAASETKKIRKKIHDSAKEDTEKLMEAWRKESEDVSDLFELAFWTMWISRWAKVYQEKAENAIKKHQEYNDRKDELYEIKDKSMELLTECAKIYPGNIKISFYRPQKPDKHHITLCDKHKDMMYEDWNMCYRYECSFGEYIRECYESYPVFQCKHCIINSESDYYSLFYIEVTSKNIPDTKFSFHVPYGLACSYMPNIKNLPRVVHQENEEGLFRFGRTLTGLEQICYKEKEVLVNFNVAYEKMSQKIQKLVS